MGKKGVVIATVATGRWLLPGTNGDTWMDKHGRIQKHCWGPGDVGGVFYKPETPRFEDAT